MVRVDKPENVQDETNSELDINRHNRLNPYPVRIGIVHEMLALVTAHPIKVGTMRSKTSTRPQALT